MFGSFPTQEAVKELEENGVRYFINLTHDYEKKITPYNTQYEYITFPITDRQIPQDLRAFACFIIRVSDIIKSLKTGELVYIHCKGGHGRSGIVVSCLLCYIFGMSAKKSLEHTTKSHNKRSVMRDKWRKIGSPQTHIQKNFVYKFFYPLNFYQDYMSGYTELLSTSIAYNVEVDNNYPSTKTEIQASKNSNDVNKKWHTPTPVIFQNIGKNVCVDQEWLNICDKTLFKILKVKFDQNPYIKEILMNTALRPLVKHTHIFGEDGVYRTVQNRIGKALNKLREKYYRESI